MKLLSLITLLLFSLSTYSQTIPKRANTIIVKGVTFENTVKVLSDSGYLFKKDSNAEAIKTEWKNLCDKCPEEVSYKIIIKNNTAIITGKWRISETPSLGAVMIGLNPRFIISNITYEREKIYRKVFEAMNKFALALKGETTYVKTK